MTYICNTNIICAISQTLLFNIILNNNYNILIKEYLYLCIFYNTCITQLYINALNRFIIHFNKLII